MRISENSFKNGGEVDYHASLEWPLTPLITTPLTGRASLRKNGMDYQAYLKLHLPATPHMIVPRLEMIVYETRVLKDAVTWCNENFHKNPELYDNYEASRART